MQVAFIILAHTNPEQLLRLVERIAHKDCDCWIHIDQKSERRQFEKTFSLPNCFEVKPSLPLEWGHFNIVQAMINGLKEAFEAEIKYDYFQFLSGMDYPLQQIRLFVDYLDQNSGTDFIGNRPLEESKQNIERFYHYHFNDMDGLLRRIAEAAVRRLLPARKFPFAFEVRKGPQWMTLSRDAVAYILQFLKAYPSYSSYFKRVLAPDEFFFQTILYNSERKGKMKNHIVHHIDWSENKKSPKTFTMNNKDILLNSPLFFARKFDENIDKDVLNVLDEKINNC